MNKPVPLRKRIRGVAAVELGILLVPLVILTFGITEYGRAIYSYNTLAKSVRDAARYLTALAPGDPAAQDDARCMALYGNANCTGTSLVPNLTPAMVEICDAVSTCPGVTTSTTTGYGTINLVVVRVNGYQYDSLVTLVMPDITFNNISVTMRAQL